MGYENIILELTLILAGCSLLATIFMYFRQPIVLAYIIAGLLIGPEGYALIKSPDRIEQISHVGIILLLFLIGMNLDPHRLVKLFKKTFLIVLGTCLAFSAVTFFIARAFGFDFTNALVIGLALMFSSTVVGLKLIPTDSLEHKHIGELITSVLLLQDILAVFLIMFLRGGISENIFTGTLILFLKIALMLGVSYLFVKYVFTYLYNKFNKVKEYIFLIPLGWCLVMAEMSDLMGFSHELGAFIGGITLATTPFAHNIIEKLKPLREFFLILFFFSIGAKFEFLLTRKILIPGLVIAFVLLVIKPLIFYLSFLWGKEKKAVGKEAAVRLGQTSEFSILVAFVALQLGTITAKSANLIQLVTIITFIISTYATVSLYPTPISDNGGNIKKEEKIIKQE